ncbi:hypothetical protein ACFPRL_05245 [Pseudoclavibacter helvolus]
MIECTWSRRCPVPSIAAISAARFSSDPDPGSMMCTPPASSATIDASVHGMCPPGIAIPTVQMPSRTNSSGATRPSRQAVSCTALLASIPDAVMTPTPDRAD